MDIINVSATTFFQKAFDLLGLSQDGFARLVGKSPTRISRYLSGEENVPGDVFEFAMDALTSRLYDPSSLFPISDERDFYYHATSAEIQMPIDVHFNEGRYNDFGSGFYLGESFRQALTWGKEKKPTLVYCFRKNKFRKLNMIDLANTLEWLFYVGLNRGKIPSLRYPELQARLKSKIASADIVKGKIADSFSFNVIELLFAGKLDVDQAEACTVLMALGDQYVVKSEAFAASLQPDRIIKLDLTLSNYFLYYGQKAQHGFDELIAKLMDSPANPNRKIDVLMGKKND